MRKIVAALTTFLSLACVTWSSASHATEDYPNRPIKTVVGFPPGGPTDVLARIFANRLSEVLPARTFIDNRPGAGANIAADAVAKSAPDGYTVLFTHVATHGISPAVYSNLSYDAKTDFRPISLVASGPLVLLTGKHVPVEDLGQLQTWAKSQKRPLTIGFPGYGTTGHVSSALLAQKGDLELTLIPYRGGAAAMQDLMAGQIDLVFDVLNTALPQINAQTVKAIGISSQQPNPALPRVPPLSASIPELVVTSWFGVAAPAGTPQPVIDRLHREVVAATKDQKVKDAVSGMGMTPLSSTPAEFETFISNEIARWKDVARIANIRVE